MTDLKYKLIITIKFDSNIDYKKMTIPEKMEYIEKLANQNISKISNQLTLDSFQIIKTHFKNYFYFVIYTLPQKNHPIIGYVSKKNDADAIYLIRPNGKKRYNVSSDDLNLILEQKILTEKEEVYALYLSLVKSIVIRKEEIFLDKEHSLLNCNNIKGCITQKRANLSNNEKKTKTAEMRMNAVNVLKKYFKLLENNEFEKAREMIGMTKKEPTEFNLTFRSLKKLHGHIAVFISLYEFIDIVISYYKNM